MEKEHCVIVGGSHAAAQLAHSLRLGGWTGAISLVSAEHLPPYHRPPLSKSYLDGGTPEGRLLIRPAAFYKKHAIDLLLNTRVLSINRAERFVQTADEHRLNYTRLALATGAEARRLDIPGSGLKGVFYLRDLADANRIRSVIRSGKTAVIIGGGYIGLETAASLRKMGLRVTLLEALPEILERVTAPQVANFFHRIHAQEGVEILTQTSANAFEGDSSVRQVHCDDGRVIDVDLVIVGIGVRPATRLAESAGLAVENGIRVDEFCRTSDPYIVAAGDCTNHFNAIYNRHVRLESVQNATDQARAAAGTLCGKLEPYNALPWFWSDQYDLKLQIAGLSDGFDEVILRGSPDRDRSFAAFYFRQGRFIAVDAINRPMEFMLGKRALVQQQPVSPAVLADESLSIRNILKQS